MIVGSSVKAATGEYGTVAMRVTIDSKPIDVGSAAGATLAELLRHVGRSLNDSGRVLFKVKLNGREVSPTGREGEQVLAETDELELTSADPRQLARETLEQVGELFEQSRNSASQAAEHLQQGQISRAMEQLAGLVGLWSSAQQAVVQTSRLLSMDLEKMQVAGESFAEHIGRFQQQLQQIKSALQNRDYVSLADILNYELPDLTDRWQSLIKAVLAEMHEQQ